MLYTVWVILGGVCRFVWFCVERIRFNDVGLQILVPWLSILWCPGGVSRCTSKGRNQFPHFLLYCARGWEISQGCKNDFPMCFVAIAWFCYASRNEPYPFLHLVGTQDPGTSAQKYCLQNCTQFRKRPSHGGSGISSQILHRSSHYKYKLLQNRERFGIWNFNELEGLHLGFQRFPAVLGFRSCGRRVMRQAGWCPESTRSHHQQPLQIRRPIATIQLRIHTPLAYLLIFTFLSFPITFGRWPANQTAGVYKSTDPPGSSCLLHCYTTISFVNFRAGSRRLLVFYNCFVL